MVAGGSDSAAAAISLSISSSNLNRGSLGIGIRSHPYTMLTFPDPEGRVHLFSHVMVDIICWSDVSRWLCVGIEIHLRRIILTPS